MEIGDRVTVTDVQKGGVEYQSARIGSEGTVSTVFSERLCEVQIDGGSKLNFWNTELTRLEP